MRAWIGIAMLGWLSVSLMACGEDAQQRKARQEAEETRAIMDQIFEGIRVALPASVDLERFEDPANQAEIAAALETIASNSALLEKHTRRRDQQMQFLARSVRDQAEEVQRSYAQGRNDRTAFLLRQLTENCVVCHTRLPSGEDSPLTRGFVSSSVLEELPAEPRATLLIATRRFDQALDTLEGLLLSPLEPPAALLGPLTDYMVVSMRVRDDYQRPQAMLRKFVERAGLWELLRSDVEAWIAALPELERRTRGEPSLATARALLEEGRSMIDLPEDRAALAHFVAASAILQRFIDSHTEVDRDLGEAYYLLGIVEARIGRNYWVTEAPFLLETAIRIAPHEAFAERAYAMLEQELLMSYEGSDWETLPPEDSQHLAELRALMHDE